MSFLLVTSSLLSYGQNSNYEAPSEADVESGNITDKDKHTMENYTHAGYQQREADEKWAEECGTSQECESIRNGGDATDGEKFMGMSPSMFKAVGQAYSIIMPAMSQAGGGGKFNQIDVVTKKDVAAKYSEKGISFDQEGKAEPMADTQVEQKDLDAAQEEHDKASEKEGTDYCQYIPMGAEVIARVTQQKSDEFALATEPDVENAQSQALYKQARSHRDRQKSVDIQRKGWGATTVCYIASMATQGGFTSGWSNWVKLGASTLMTSYYMWEHKMHGDAADKLNNVANKLSGKGKCNPVSDRDCYCSQPETMNDVKYCYPQIRQRTAQNNNWQVTCVDNNVKEDLNCTCRQTNSCLDSRISSKIGGMYIPGGLGTSLDDFYKMTNGISTPGDSSNSFKSTSGKIFAMANDKLKEGLNKINLPANYKKKDAKIAEGLRKLGFDGAVANAISATPETSESKSAEAKLKSRASGLRGKVGKYTASYKPKNNGLYFRGGSGLDNKKKNKKKAVNPYAHLLKKKKKDNANASAEILDFSKRAQRNAGITKDKSSNIFEIISRRYRYSASKKLGAQ
ncbi:hypothetical protein [Bacteriovorax sp. BAL6_X]|uniref:hypothetical protein n=1 Tax=Bacteriovorax sp. BAL6_X TaxID=1201290 RepID=UPI0012ED11A4|nr:hypothetical protein [Bacteriovorax sp. BAL6_X]